MDTEIDQEADLKKLDEKIKDAEENFGDVEIRDAILDKAQFLQKINRLEEAVNVFNEAYKKTIGIGKKMDIIFFILLIYLKQKNLQKIKESIDRQKKLLEEGGDWERKNKLKVYDGIYMLMIRDFKNCSTLFLDTVQTFSCPEVIPFKDLIFYTVVVSMVSLPRSDISKKVMHNPEILSTIRETPFLKDFLESFYKCDYKAFFVAFYQILELIGKDQYLGPHKKYFTREMRVVIYQQFLESYKTVKLQTMADAFGVSVDFIDRELSQFIASRRISSKIDKVAGIVESEKLDERNNLYKVALKEGDHLLNRVQKLSRIIDI